MIIAANESPEYENLAQLAAGYEGKGETVKAARFYAMAGEIAARHYQNEDAVANLSKALNHTPDSEIDGRFSLLLARERVYALTGQQEAWKQDLASLEFLAGVLRSEAGRGQVVARQANYHLETGAHETAVSFAQTAVHLAELARSPETEAAAHLTWGLALLNQGNHDYALTQFSQALQKTQGAADAQLEADSIRAIGLYYLNHGDLPQARFSYEQAQAIYERIGDYRGLSYIQNNLGHIAYDQKRFTVAQGYWDQALQAHQAIGEQLGMAMANANSGAMYMDIGQYERAEQYTHTALQISTAIKSVMGHAMGSLNLALIKHYQGEQAEAEQFSRQTLELARQMNSRRIEGYALIPLGHALFAQGNNLAAREAYWESLSIWHELKQPNLAMEQRAGLARTHAAAGEDVLALAQVERIFTYLQQHPELEGVESTFRVYQTVIEVLFATGDERAALMQKQGQKLLEEQAGAFKDEAARLSFLQNVAPHAAIMAQPAA